ncbi:type VI secretion system-associated protein TagF [bacterium M00.F.Ca.ET.228.01.1.1]|uniref:Type VI secretion-associated protein, BMA_A0400 family n=1 Tax=Burkholderia sp. (strain CCGE1003) TaxID=640512 RepID=E1TGJ1_BURSG|nr:type VI secretion system-associated protein TagF [Paraburkholderia phenoliruptrix]MBW9130505.1 type VI secretion system-associated protein TagF [Paraburkholderia ginsengiterrae]TGP40661.1 type VI secretion system-associated protein TagF [bacterium M00.F.Ca.ET.228.01.1.1]TGR96912.1 type VI secretion system-associated protein TagF [bacterium M00.F.Ca.ET.191.01.1.1]TGT98222.1 type VI secretion system-associated protein TagF [bacterium M00.F.Ca.ET.155.01.1.1]MBW0448156.1 type VI secretion syste
MTQTVQAQIAYFGKIPSRGDFVKSAHNPQLLATLDRWIAEAMELLTDDPRWKIVYENAKPMHFAFLGSRSKLAIAGHMVASHDQSSRRFPFLAATALEVEKPLTFLAHSPLAFARLWSRVSAQMKPLLGASEPAGALQALGETQVPIEIGGGPGNPHDGTFNDFVEHQTLAGLEQMLLASGHPVRLRGAMLALGSLLRPVMQSGSSHLERGLTLPLPNDPFYRSLVAAFWLELIAPFVAQADFELAIFIGTIAERERLIIGFNGASAKTLHSVVDPQAYAAHNIDIDDPEWIDEHAQNDHGISKLVSYLDQPQLSLRVSIDTFREAFTGA